MKLNNLRPSEGGGVAKRKRVGRGIGSGLGKTSGKGHKGQNARAGKGTRVGFEGGQTPLFQRLPKRGFTNVNHKEYAIINVGDLRNLEEGTTVTPELLFSEGLVKKNKAKNGIKILGNGELDRELIVQAHKFSKSAIEKIEAAGGKVEVI